jgi:hypothetical protein
MVIKSSATPPLTTGSNRSLRSLGRAKARYLTLNVSPEKSILGKSLERLNLSLQGKRLLWAQS